MGAESAAAATPLTAEEGRLAQARDGVPWRRWGPYLSERQWGTVREDYSDDGDAWSYFSHDQARSRAYRWGEDGLAGISDDKQWLCLALALWNERDPILKERLFGLTNAEGNHGEDVKEYYFYLDNLPTHSYQRWLYKYPQGEFPYNELVTVNRARTRQELEYELIDTGVFGGGHYFDVEVEHAKAGPEDIICRVTVHNRSGRDAALRVLPTLWFRNTWSGGADPRPRLCRDQAAHPVIRAEHHELGRFYLHAQPGAGLLFCENETNAARLWQAGHSPRFPKDGISEHILHGAETVNPSGEGTKAAAHVRLQVPAGGNAAVLVRLTRAGPRELVAPFAGASELISARRAEADAFYDAITPPAVSGDARAVMRQALAGMLWSKQCYYFDVDLWLRERGAHPLRAPVRRGSRNESWFHMFNHDVVSMPDKWEYPWYAAWDLAFHCIPLAMVDPDFAKGQIDLMLSQGYLHPHGIRSISRWDLAHPYTLDVAGVRHEVRYEPAESASGMFGGNSNWRGPVWFPVNMLLIRALIQHYRYYGDSLKVECPTGSGTMMTLFEVSQELSRRLIATFLRDGAGQRPVYGGTKLFQADPHWRDHILFYEYFHGDNGAGLGASHQTGWTGLVARLIQGAGQFEAAAVLNDPHWPMARPYRHPRPQPGEPERTDA
jgi:hypothetical protein